MGQNCNWEIGSDTTVFHSEIKERKGERLREKMKCTDFARLGYIPFQIKKRWELT